MKILNLIALVCLYSSFSVAETTYPSMNWLPFPWEAPEQALNVEAVGYSVPTGEFVWKSRLRLQGEEPKLVDGCNVSIEKDEDENNLIFKVSGSAMIYKDGEFNEAQADSEFILPLNHFVQPLRETPYVRFGFPDVYMTTGELKEKEDSTSLRIIVRKGFVLGKTANTPWIVSPMGVSESAFLSFSKNIDAINGISMSGFNSNDEFYSLNCVATEDVKLNSNLNINNLFLKDL